MNPLAFPTDNLYKFIALSGSALLITSFVFPLTWLNEIELAAQQTSAQRKVLDVELSALEVDLKQLGANVKRLDAAVDANSRAALALQDGASQARARLFELDKRRLTLGVKKAEIQGNEEKSALLLKQMDRTWSYLKIGGAAGLVLTQIGFFLWYRRVQRPADIEAQKKATASGS
jgi:hypothetical protein